VIILVRLEAPREFARRARVQRDLPAADAPVSALAVWCPSADDVRAAFDWRAARGGAFETPFVLVVREEPEMLRMVALEPAPPTALLFERELEDGRLRRCDFEAVWRGSVFAQVEANLVERYGRDLEAGPAAVLREVVALGACGRRAATAARALGLSESTLRRWLRRRGLPPLGRLLRCARLEAARIAREAGMDADLAARNCGWSGYIAYRAAVRRGGGVVREGSAVESEVAVYGVREWLGPVVSVSGRSPSSSSAPASSPSSGGAKR
jgi:hypothetical protein